MYTILCWEKNMDMSLNTKSELLGVSGWGNNIPANFLFMEAPSVHMHIPVPKHINTFLNCIHCIVVVLSLDWSRNTPLPTVEKKCHLVNYYSAIMIMTQGNYAIMRMT